MLSRIYERTRRNTAAIVGRIDKRNTIVKVATIRFD